MSSLNIKGKILVLAILMMAGWMCLGNNTMHRKVSGGLGPLPVAKPEQIDLPQTPITPPPENW